MAKKLSLSDTSIIHILDKTIGMEDNANLLMCGKDAGKLDKRHYAVNPIHENMPPICEKADKEGRLCPECKLGVTFYAKGVHKGEISTRLQFVKDMMSVVEGAKEHATTH